MKKFLLSMAAAMTMAGANAGVVELNVNDATDIQGTLVEETMKPDGSVQAAKHYEDLTSLQLGGYGFTFTHVSGNNAPTYYYATSTNPKQQCDIRVYNEATMTITAPPVKRFSLSNSAVLKPTRRIPASTRQTQARSTWLLPLS